MAGNWFYTLLGLAIGVAFTAFFVYERFSGAPEAMRRVREKWRESPEQTPSRIRRSIIGVAAVVAIISLQYKFGLHCSNEPTTDCDPNTPGPIQLLLGWIFP